MVCDDPHWKDIERALDALLDVPQSDRPKILETLYVEDAGLATRVEKLLALAELESTIPESAAAIAPDLFAAIATDEANQPIGMRLGPYRITEFIQRGGMGAVYRGERSDGTFEQSVAIKLVPTSLGSDTARAMFERERQHIARLEHPNIARIIDAGVIDDDTPYFVMEFIDGIQIGEFLYGAKQEKILQTFLQLCEAVAYCHRSFIVHGDLKPANVLVADNRVRLLDFGIGQVIEGSQQMLHGELPAAYSPGFASPEQLKGNGVSVRSDIYSLGALLKNLLDASDENALSTDLSAIVDKSMRALPDERYTSVDALRNDLQAYLANYPIAARDWNMTERAANFVQRNTLLVGATAGIFASLTIGLAVAAWQYESAKNEAKRSTQVTEFLTSIFERADPYKAGERDITLIDVVDSAAERVETELSGTPQVQHEVKELIGNAYYGVGEFDKAFELHQETLAYWRDNAQPPHLQIVRALNALGRDYRELGEYENAIELHRQAIEQLDALGASNSLEAWESWTRLGYSLKQLNPEGGTDAFLRAHEINTLIRPDDPAAIARSLGQIASGYRSENRIAEAANYREQALAIADANNEVLAPDIVSIRCALALDYGTLARFDEAYAMQKLCIEQTTERLGARHPWQVWYMSNLGSLDLRFGRLAEAEATFLEAVSIAEEKLPPKSIGRLAAEINYAVVLWQSGRPGEAAINLRQILERMEASVGPAHRYSGRVRSILGRVILEQDDASAAVRLINGSLGALTDVWRSDALLWLAEAKLALGERRAAIVPARESLNIRRESLDFTRWQIAEAELVLAQATGSESDIASAIRVFEQQLPPHHFRRK